MGIELSGVGGVSFETMAEFPDEAKKGMPPVAIPVAEIASGDFIAQPFRVPDGKTLKVWALGVQTINQDLPSGLSAVVYDETNSVSASYQNKYKEGDPVRSVTGPADVTLRTNNGTNNSQTAGSFFTVTLE